MTRAYFAKHVPNYIPFLSEVLSIDISESLSTWHCLAKLLKDLITGPAFYDCVVCEVTSPKKIHRDTYLFFFSNLN